MFRMQVGDRKEKRGGLEMVRQEIHKLPSRFWEPEDDRTEDELIAAYLEEKHEQEDELPFE